MSPKITLFLPSLAGGGAERVFAELANEFVALGCQVDLALAKAEGPYLREVASGVRVVDFDSPSVLRSIPKLARHLRSERPDAILSGLDHANVAAVLSSFLSGNRVRCVISMRSVPTMLHREAGFVRARMVLEAARGTHRFADAIIANSEGVASDLTRFLRIPRSKVSVIYNPLNLAVIGRLSREAIVDSWCAPGSPPLILSVGRFSALKDFPTLIRAFSIVRSRRECRLAILGEGPDRSKLESIISELGLGSDVYLPGFVMNPFAWMRQSSVFVSSSLSEGCPNALMQALACGTPVISTDCVGGSAEVLQGGEWGNLVPVGDPDAMANAIMAVFGATSHPNVLQRAGDFALAKVARQYLEVLLPDRARLAAES